MHKPKGFIQIYTKESRENIFEIAGTHLIEEKLEKISPQIFSCIDELIKNAVKANYKFLVIKSKIKESLKEKHKDSNNKDIEEKFTEILKNKKQFDTLAEKIISKNNISKEVRDILNEEGKYLKIKNKAFDENREMTEEEKNTLNDLTRLTNIREQIKENNIKIILDSKMDEDFIYYEITNTAPILRKDLKRIYEKRMEYKKYRDENREHEFFINNLDTSESGFGLGYATIDSFLLDCGLDPEHAATIVSSINTTAVLILPIADLKNFEKLKIAN